MPSWMSLGCIIGALSLIATADVDAQQLLVQRNANLRRDPSTQHTPVRVMAAGDTVLLLTVHSTNDFLRVRAGSDTGWVWSGLVELVSLVAPAAPVAPPGVTTAPRDFHDCPLPGDAVDSSVKLLNLLKNRFTAPPSSVIDPAVSLAAMLAPGTDDHRFDSARGGVVEGIVVAVKVGGVETVNCKTTDSLFRDTHVEVATTAGAPAIRRIIVEITPRWRAAMKAAGADWTTQGLQSLVGKHVRFRGWLMFDVEHRNQSENTAPGKAANWRATAWELHPVTSFVIIPQ